MAGVCVALRDRSADEVVAVLGDRIDADPPLLDLGVPVRMERALRETLGRGRRDEWGVPGGELARDAAAPRRDVP